MISPNEELSVESNLEGLVAMLAEATTDRSGMSDSEIGRWALMYRAFLMVERKATLDDVFTVARTWLAHSRFFPTVGDLASPIEGHVAARLRAEEVAQAQVAATPVAMLDGVPDYAAMPTRDLPPGYDYAGDPHWQRGLKRFQALKAEGAHSSWGQALANIPASAPGFQGATKARTLDCPDCKGARYLRLGEWDAGRGEHFGRLGSHYVACPTCCPYGTYDPQAERAAAQAAALSGALA